jgi:hypothetical protein
MQPAKFSSHSSLERRKHAWGESFGSRRSVPLSTLTSSRGHLKITIKQKQIRDKLRFFNSSLGTLCELKLP